jgi:large subunit ribosomal protein L18
MGYHPKEKLIGRSRRKVRVRKKIFGTAQRPRLSVFRSAKYIYAQVIDDVSGKTLASASSRSKGLRVSLSGNKTDRSKAVGLALAEACKNNQVTEVTFDRNGYRFHGRVKAVADGAREGGLEF